MLHLQSVHFCGEVTCTYFNGVEFTGVSTNVANFQSLAFDRKISDPTNVRKTVGKHKTSILTTYNLGKLLKKSVSRSKPTHYFKTLGQVPSAFADSLSRFILVDKKLNLAPRKCSFQVNVLDGARETLVLLGVIVLQTNLDFHCLKEVAFLVLGRLEHGIDALIECITRHFRPKKWGGRVNVESNLGYVLTNPTVSVKY